MFITSAFAQTAGAAGGADMTTTIMQVVPFILIFIVMYFFMIRPQQTKQKAHRAMLKALGRNDTVITTGGLIGKITHVVDDQEVMVEIADNVRVRVSRAHIQDRFARGEPLKPSNQN